MKCAVTCLVKWVRTVESAVEVNVLHLGIENLLLDIGSKTFNNNNSWFKRAEDLTENSFKKLKDIILLREEEVLARVKT